MYIMWQEPQKLGKRTAKALIPFGPGKGKITIWASLPSPTVG
jgi:hypothetical protein